jgi:hypothetical protein
VTVDDDILSRELDRGSSTHLPPNIPPGFLGEVSPDLRRVDEFEPTLNAGITLEKTWETQWLVIGLLYFLVITGPVAFWLLWREPHRKTWAKVTWTLLALAGYVAAYFGAIAKMSS